MNKKRMFVNYIYGIIKCGELTLNASALAYSFVLSFVPLIVMFLSLLGYFAIPDSGVYETLEFFLPSEVYEVVMMITRQVLCSPEVGKYSVIPFIYFISRACRAVIRTTDEVYGCGKRGGIRLYILSFVYSAFLPAMMVVMLVSVVFGGTIIDMAFAFFNIPEGGFAEAAVNVLRFAFSLAVLWGFLCVVYIASPSVRLYPRDVYKGALFGSVMWSIVSMIFSFYVNNFSGYGILYGSLGGIFILLVWLYMSSYIMLLGVYINRWVSILREDD